MNEGASLNKRFVITGLLVVFTVLFLGLFSQSDKVNPVFQTFLVSITFFLVVPMLYCKIVLKEPLKNIGWQAGKLFPGIFLSLASISVALALIFVLNRYTGFGTGYSLSYTIQSNFLWFLLYEACLVPFMALLYEVFFRGLVQRLWLNSFGLTAVLVQSVLFAGLLFLADDLSWQRVPALIFSLFSGIIVYYSGSLWYAWGASWFFYFLIDIFRLVLH